MLLVHRHYYCSVQASLTPYSKCGVPLIAQLRSHCSFIRLLSYSHTALALALALAIAIAIPLPLPLALAIALLGRSFPP